MQTVGLLLEDSGHRTFHDLCRNNRLSRFEAKRETRKCPVTNVIDCDCSRALFSHSITLPEMHNLAAIILFYLKKN